MSLKRITYNQALKKTGGNKAELGRIFNCSRNYVWECINGSKKTKRKIYLTDKHEKRFRKHFGMSPRFTG